MYPQITTEGSDLGVYLYEYQKNRIFQFCVARRGGLVSEQAKEEGNGEESDKEGGLRYAVLPLTRRILNHFPPRWPVLIPD